MTRKKQEEFLKLYEPVHERFERFCRARVYGNMEFRDLMNETLLIAYERFDSLQSKGSFLSFLIGISVRVLANNNRKKRFDLVENEEKIKSFKDENVNVESKMEVYLLHQALSYLPEEQREAIILFEITGFNIKEIASIQSASESAVKQRLKRGRDKLRSILVFESSNKNGGKHGK